MAAAAFSKGPLKSLVKSRIHNMFLDLRHSFALQKVSLPSGGDVYVLDSTYTQAYVPDSDASCPNLALLALVLVSLAFTVFVNAWTSPSPWSRALSSAAVNETTVRSLV